MYSQTSFLPNSVDKSALRNYDKNTIWNGFHTGLHKQTDQNCLFMNVERVLQYFLSRGGNNH